MTTPLVRTKWMTPLPSHALIERPRLLGRLNESQSHRLTLLTAPVGSGKTALLSQWCAGRSDVAWLSLDESDAEPGRFAAYLAQALGMEGEVEVEALPAQLINRLAGLEQEFTLVLDDYHLADHPWIRRLMVTLLDRLPPRFHLVIAVQGEPALPLARLRAQRALCEITARELALTRPEIAQLLQGLDLHLPEQALAILQERTEGWAAGVQLAALSLQAEPDLVAAVDSIRGDQRFIFDYLAEEVFARVPDPVQYFLLQTAHLARVSGPLADAVTLMDGSQQMLEELERLGLFVSPLDQGRRWWRYHPLFAQFLRQQWGREHGGDLAELHRRAAAWFAADGDLQAAVDHWLAAGEHEEAAEVLLHWAPSLLSRGEVTTLLRLSARLRPEAVGVRPRLALQIAWAHLMANQADGAARWLAGAGLDDELAGLGGGAPNGIPPGEVAAARAMLALLRGNLPGAVAHGRRALLDLPAESHGLRASTAQMLGRVAWIQGDLGAAAQAYEQAVTCGGQSGRTLPTLSARFNLCHARAMQGELRQAVAGYEQALAEAASAGLTEQPVVALGELWLAEALLEQGETARAQTHAEHGLALVRPIGNPEALAHGLLTLARVYLALGEPVAARPLVAEALGLGRIRSYVEAVEASLLQAEGDLAGLGRWVDAFDRQAPPRLQTELEQITLGRALLALGRADEAREHLLRLAQSAERQGWGAVAARARALLAEAQPATGPLSQREMDVLRLLAEGAANQEIARRLFLTEGTAKWHIHNILAKLEARTRTEAVARARSLRILP